LARKYYEAALRHAPHSAPAHFGLGQLEYQAKRPFDALYHFEQAVQWNPQFSEAHFDLGLFYKNMGRDDDAAKSFLKSVETDRDNSLYRNNLALEFAEEEARRALILDPDNAEAKEILKKIKARKK
jgi:Flp pilus assembly protein TadD